MGRFPLRTVFIALAVVTLCVSGGCTASRKAVGVSPAVAGASPDIVGTYGARLPAADSPGRIIRLTLFPDRQAAMVSDYLNGKPPIVESGTWEPRPDGTVTVTLAGREASDRSQTITFASRKDGLATLVFDKDAWGAEGITVQRDPDIIGRSWRLVQIRFMDDSVLTPDDPAKYTLELAPDGKASVRADCNRGAGSYLLAGNSLTFQRFAYTRAECPPGSLFTQYTWALEMSASCVIRDGYLYIAMAADGGILTFTPAGIPGDEKK